MLDESMQSMYSDAEQSFVTTPLRKGPRARGAQGAATSKRRSDAAALVSVSALNASNDDLERLERRNQVQQQKRLSHIPAIGGSINDYSDLASEELIGRIQMCNKMFAENRITNSNIWKVDIIDYLKTFMTRPGDRSETEQLMIAAPALDVSAKVYGMRVDDAHLSAMRLLSDLTRASAQSNIEDALDESTDVAATGDGGLQGGEGDEQQRAAKRRRVVRRQQKAVLVPAKDRGKLLAAIQQTDEAFFQTRTNSDRSSIENLFTLRLEMGYDCHKFQLHSEETAWIESPDEGNEEQRVQTEPTQMPREIAHLPETPLVVSKGLDFFALDEFDVEKVALYNAEALDDVVYNKDGCPVPDLDPFLDNDVPCGEDMGAASEDEGAGDQHDSVITDIVIPNEHVTYVTDLMPTNTQHFSESEYSYVSGAAHSGLAAKCQVWAGPSYWKFNHIRRVANNFTGKLEEKNKVVRLKRKKDRENTPLHFTDSDNSSQSKCKINRKIRQVSDRTKIQTYINWDDFYMDVHYHHRLLTLAVMVPSARQRVLQRAQKIADEERGRIADPADDDDGGCDDFGADDGDAGADVAPYNYDNPNDAQYCSRNGVDIEVDNDGTIVDDAQVSQSQTITTQNFVGTNLVERPEMVDAVMLNYAKRAKTMDMKKLKTRIWTVLTSKPQYEVNVVASISEEGVKLSELLATLDRSVPQNMRENLSVPITVVALLHMCNETGISVHNNDTNEMIIRSSQQNAGGLIRRAGLTHGH